MASTLFDDIFHTESVETDRYDRVARLTASSVSDKDVRLTLDINSELFPVTKGSSISLAVAQTLSLDGEVKPPSSGWREAKPGERTLADDYDYVMYGTVYKFEESSGDKISVYISFGGLLMSLEGGYRKLSNLKQENVYLLLRR
ncbi:similar to Saccharomyces cerevisiae YOR224C RPB8 RNA polymerase subunit ABC14.55, common to RNA polymerases I, II, and III [Geotrichum candidum]|uniref:DNA-directed RNA polymerases I, II, and III subunit RPABC3 n=1 Tax=Geotrichum candidum TaxID=1173061 RepID=A0A0J9X899_GEOCN|nr:similar to Saccharomyces cerevisiae YOR224C RPB8 RNA polymerase subunit ABC14.55, common to RNA polymerases I, II, and III [Geotrichum candidum]